MNNYHLCSRNLKKIKFNELLPNREIFRNILKPELQYFLNTSAPRDLKK